MAKKKSVPVINTLPFKDRELIVVDAYNINWGFANAFFRFFVRYYYDTRIYAFRYY